MLCLCTAGLSSAARGRESTILQLGTPVPIDPAVELGIPVATALTRAGGLIVADMATNELVELDARGHEVRRFGGKGDGPGEFQLLYRIAFDGEERLWAFDLQRQDFTIFSDSTDDIPRLRLPFRFRQVDGIVPLSGGGVAIAGVTRWGDSGTAHAIHLFNDHLRYQGSFGEPPEVAVDWVLDRWGMGGLTKLGDDHLVYTRRLPYEIVVLSEEGTTSATWKSRMVSEFRPEDAFSREVDGNRVTYKTLDVPVLRPHTARAVGDGWLLAGHTRGSERSLDLWSPDGRLLESQPIPSEWKSVAAVDSLRQILWVAAEEKLAPTFDRVPYSLISGG